MSPRIDLSLSRLLLEKIFMRTTQGWIMQLTGNRRVKEDVKVKVWGLACITVHVSAQL